MSYKELLPIYRKWYPKENNYKKVVPRDLELTPEHILHWFMDDGYSCFRNRHTATRVQKKQVIVCFCSESFTKEDQMFLIEQMDRKFGIKSSVRKTKGGTGWRIFVHQSCADHFFEVIGPCPVPSMQYKWK